MFIFGSGHKTIRIPINNVPPCGTCRRDSQRVIAIDYDYSHIFWLFKGLKNKVVVGRCEACGTSVALDKSHEKDVYRALGRNPIPFMDRYGALVLIAIVAAWVAFVFAIPCAVNPTSDLCTRP